MSRRPLHLLLVEDDDVDAELIVRGLQKAGSQQPITVVNDGIEALALLRGLSGPPPLTQPYLIITDINMPRMNGLELLRELRRDPQFARSVIFVLSGSALDTDKLAAYDQQIAGYLLKAKVTENFSLLLRLVQYYAEIVEFPR